MCGESEDIQFKNIPIMTELQHEFLDKYIGGIMKMMDNFAFGVPYGGPNESSYTPRTFNLGGKVTPWEDWPPDDDDDDTDKDHGGRGVDGNGDDDLDREHPWDREKRRYCREQALNAGLQPGTAEFREYIANCLGAEYTEPTANVQSTTPTANIQSVTPTWSNVLSNMSANQQPFRVNTIPLSQAPKPQSSNYLSQILTGPIVSPFRYGLTGNYPKK
jgi:hypothetical protein